VKLEGVCYIAAVALVAACILTPARSQARQNFSIDLPDSADRCADLNVRSSGQVARSAESFTVTRSEAPTLEVSGLENANIRVRGWERPDYSVEACKIAAASGQGAADQLLKDISVTRNGGRFSASGPATGDNQWLVVFLVHAPKDASLDLQTKNGPIGVRDVSGTTKARAVNGPISIAGCSGAVDARATNGPISFEGGAGDVRLNAENGPISLRLSGDEWSGPALVARTVNGPLSVKLSDAFRSGVRIETSGHAPLSCGLEACRNAHTDATANRRILELNAGNATVQLSTANGPISVGTGSKSRSVI